MPRKEDNDPGEVMTQEEAEHYHRLAQIEEKSNEQWQEIVDMLENHTLLALNPKKDGMSTCEGFLCFQNDLLIFTNPVDAVEYLKQIAEEDSADFDVIAMDLQTAISFAEEHRIGCAFDVPTEDGVTYIFYNSNEHGFMEYFLELEDDE